MFSDNAQQIITCLRKGEPVSDADACAVRLELSPILDDISRRLFTGDADAEMARAQQIETGEIVDLLENHLFRGAENEAA